MNETLKILKERRSVRRYEARPVEREKLDAILEAGKYAPSAKGQQSQAQAGRQHESKRFLHLLFLLIKFGPLQETLVHGRWKRFQRFRIYRNAVVQKLQKKSDAFLISVCLYKKAFLILDNLQNPCPLSPGEDSLTRRRLPASAS